MKTTKQTAANFTLGGGSYKSPEVIISEMFNEGVLCSSTPEATIQEWESGSIDW